MKLVLSALVILAGFQAKADVISFHSQSATLASADGAYRIVSVGSSDTGL
jgi:hypothetical protein